MKNAAAPTLAIAVWPMPFQDEEFSSDGPRLTTTTSTWAKQCPLFFGPVPVSSAPWIPTVSSRLENMASCERYDIVDQGACGLFRGAKKRSLEKSTTINRVWR